MAIKQTGVISIQDKRSEKPLYNIVQLVLKNLGEFSSNTANSYGGYYREFFKLTLNKELEFVTWDDLLSITYEGVLGYRESLKGSNINKTINVKVASLNTLFKELYKADRRVDLVVVDLNKLPEHEEDSLAYGSLTQSEVEGLLDYCMGLQARQKPLVKALFFEVAYVSAIRQGALLSLTWGHLRRVKDKDTGKGVWIIKVKDKGTVSETPISDELYGRLVELKNIKYSNGYRDQPTDKIFNVTRKTLSRTLKEYCEQAGIDEDRNIVLHSLKKASMDRVYDETRDINMTARHGHHKSVNMTYETYQGQNRSYVDSPSYVMFEGETNSSGLEDFTKEELIEAIHKSGQFTINQILSNLGQA